MEKNHNESVLISVNQRLKKIQIPKPETSNHKPQTFQLKINHNESVLISVK